MIKEALSKLTLNSDFARNAFTLTLGSGIAQAIPLFLYPILGRMFTPSEFGLFATILAATSIIGIISTGKYDSCILITETKQESADAIGLTLLLSFFVLVISYIFILLFSNQISIWLNSPSLKDWLYIIPLNAFVIVVFSCYNEWCVRNKYFKGLAWNKILNSGSNNLAKLFLGVYKISNNGLIIGDFVGRTITASICVFLAFRKDKIFFSKISRQKMKELSIKYSKFPIYFMPGQLINAVGSQSAVFLIGIFYSSVEVGYYAMTTVILSIPTSLISVAIKDTFRQRANEDYIKNGDCRPVFIKTFKLLMTIVIFGLVLVIFFLPAIFRIGIGEQWQVSGEYAQILAPMIGLSFIANSLSGVMIIAEKLKADFFFQVYYTSISFISLFIGFYFFNNMNMSLICYSIGLGSAYLLKIYLSFIFTKKRHDVI